MKKVYAGVFLLLVALMFFSWGSIRISSRITDADWLAREANKVRNDFEGLAQAYRDRDYERVWDYMHRRVRVSEGASETYENRFAELVEQLDSDDVTIQQFFITSEPLFYRSRNDEYVIVPTSTVVSYGFGNTRYTGFLLGTKESTDPDWKYMDMSGSWENARDVVRRHFYDMPKDIPIPKCSMEYVDAAKAEPAAI